MALPLQQLDDFRRTLRQRLHEGAAIGFGHDPIVENDDDAAVGLGANQTADALPKFQDRFRQRILGERVAAARLNQFKLRFDQRRIGNGEGQTRDDDVESASPGTSTPPQKLSVPNSTLRGVDLNCSRSFVRGVPPPCIRRLNFLSTKKRSISPAACCMSR
jgi:hypothetical protein